MRAGILTGGGDAPGINAVIRGFVKTLKKNEPGMTVVGFEDGFRGMLESRYVILDRRRVSGILHKGGTILGTTNRDNPFAMIVNGKTVDMSDMAVETYHRLKLDCLAVIGGDGTLSIAGKFVEKGLDIIAVPKTIDNDFPGTDMTFGFMTAVNAATSALDALHTTAESHHRVHILETMGRDAGWIALYSGLAGGADVILVPEIPFEMNSVLRKISERKRSGKKFSIIVAAEGAFEKGSEKIYGRTGNLGGIGNHLEKRLGEYGIDARTTALGHIQRGGSPCSCDRIIATGYGCEAARLFLDEVYNRAVVLRGGDMTNVSIRELTGKTKNIEKSNLVLAAAREVGISFGGAGNEG